MCAASRPYYTTVWPLAVGLEAAAPNPTQTVTWTLLPSREIVLLCNLRAVKMAISSFRMFRLMR